MVATQQSYGAVLSLRLSFAMKEWQFLFALLIQSCVALAAGAYDLQCSDNSTVCCFLSETESCPLTKIAYDTPALIFPGGNTRCIKSTSTPYGIAFFVLLS